MTLHESMVLLKADKARKYFLRLSDHLLTAQFQFDSFHEDVANPIQPAETCNNATCLHRHGHIRQLYAQVHAVDQVTVAADCASYLAAKARLAVDA